ncbi:hypothetical protein D3C80_1107800 [compost metagenome]
MVQVDKGLAHFIAAFVIGRVQVFAEGAGVLDLHEGAQRIVEQVQVGVRLQALHQVGIVLDAAQAEERFVHCIGAVARLCAQLQPSAVGQAMVAQAIERIGGFARCIQKAVVLDPARRAGTPRPTVLQGAGSL